MNNYGIDKDIFDNFHAPIYKDMFDFEVQYPEVLKLFKLNSIVLDFQTTIKSLKESMLYPFQLKEQESLLNQLKKLVEEYSENNLLNINNIKEDLKNISEFRKKGYSLLVNSYNQYDLEIDANDFEYSPEFLNFISEHSEAAGVYFLMNEDKEILYIGQSRRLSSRIAQHINIRIQYVTAIRTISNVDRFVYEPYFILKYRPKNNTQFKEHGEISVDIVEPIIPEPIKVFVRKSNLYT